MFLILTTPFALISAEIPGSSIMSFQDQIVNQINSLFHIKSGFSLELSKTHIVEYSLIGSIALVIIVVIASSARSKNKKQIKK